MARVMSPGPGGTHAAPSPGSYGPACSMASQLIRKRMNRKPQLLSREKCSFASDTGNGLARAWNDKSGLECPGAAWVMRTAAVQRAAG